MVEVIGHRGSSKKAPENTLAAVNLAFFENADGVEVDVRLTKDKELVCIHDKDTLRTAGHKEFIFESTLESLKTLDVGLRKGKRWKGETIPTLSEVLKKIPQKKKIFIEVKEGTESIDPLIRNIQENKLEYDQITVVSFHEEVVAKIKQEMHQVSANLLIHFEDGTIPSEEIIKRLFQSNLDGVGVQNHAYLTNDFVNPILREGKKVHVWTVDDVDKAKSYKKMGLSSITTNVPGLIKSSI